VHQRGGYAEGPSPINLPAQVPFTIGGSGSAYIYGLCDKLWRVREAACCCSPGLPCCGVIVLMLPREPLLDAAQHSTAAGICQGMHPSALLATIFIAHAAAQHDGRGVPGICGEGGEPRHGARRQQRRLHPHGRDQQGWRQAQVRARVAPLGWALGTAGT